MLTAVFIVGKVGEVVDDYRIVNVEKVHDSNATHSENDCSFDRIKCRLWSGNNGLLYRLKDETAISLKGRLEEKKGEVHVVIELFRVL